MSRSRRYGEDLTYAEEHRRRLPELYGRIGHRLDMADRDWTEFCHHCKEPLAIVEEVRDMGQDLNDKATTVTRRLAARAALPAYLMAWRIERPANVQAEIDRLNDRIRELEAAYPIVGFRARQLFPRRTALIAYTPEKWFELVLIWHRSHHETCAVAKRNREKAVAGERLALAKHRSPLWTPDNDQPPLWPPGMVAA